MQWRQPPERVDRRHESVVDLGRGVLADLAHSDRVGPGVLLLEGGGRSRVARWNEAGFTILAPRCAADDLDDRTLTGAARFLVENWHPRLGVVAVGGPAVSAAKRLLELGCEPDVLVLYEGVPTPATSTPVVAHLSAAEYGRREQRLFEGLVEAGGEVEIYLYEAPPVASDPAAETKMSLVDERTLDALAHYLS